MYHEGLGVPDDEAEVVQWFHSLAEKKHIMAQHRLAEIYFSGKGIDQDYIQAYAWSGIVAARGFKLAENIRDQIEKQLDEKELKKARELAREYWTKYGQNFEL